VRVEALRVRRRRSLCGDDVRLERERVLHHIPSEHRFIDCQAVLLMIARF
jgi:hypothetical protein